MAKVELKQPIVDEIRGYAEKAQHQSRILSGGQLDRKECRSGAPYG